MKGRKGGGEEGRKCLIAGLLRWWRLGEGVLLQQLLAGMGPEAGTINMIALAHSLLAGLPHLLDAGGFTKQAKDQETGRYLSGLAFGLPWLSTLWR